MTRQPPAAGGRVEGTATSVSLHEEGGRSVLRFRLTGEDERVVPVEMRGDEVRGVLAEGDLVALEGYRPGETHRPAVVRNLTTGSTVEAWSPSGVGRLLRHGELRTALVSAIVTSTFGLAVGWLGSSADPVLPGVEPGGTPEPDHHDTALWLLALGAAVVLLAAGALLVRRRRARAEPDRPRTRAAPARQVAAAAVGVAAGVALVALVLSA